MALLSAEAVSFAFPQAGHGLEPVSLQVEPGQALFIQGDSGCGKSTLARCLSGLIPHLYHGDYSGSVALDGLCVEQTPLWKLSEKAGLVFQNPAAQMLAGTVEGEILFGLENSGLPLPIAQERLEKALQDYGLAALRQRAPQTLSGGEQQKLALAAITARHPQVLVLDEPLSMLDTSAASQFVAALADLVNAGTALVICEHRQDYLKNLPNLMRLELPGRNQPQEAEALEFSPAVADSSWELQVKDLSVRRDGNLILDRINLELPGGTLVALVGRNGAGKTTLLRAMAGLQPYSGELAISKAGQPIKPELGLVFQNADLQLFNATVREEILYRIPQPDLRLYFDLLRALDLERYEQAPPLLLSEGEKRRLALASVLMRQPEHGILLDEPALGQDAAHKAMLLRILRAIAASGKLALFSTHDIELASQADVMMLLHPAGIIASGTPQQVLADQAAWQKLGLLIPEWLQR